MFNFALAIRCSIECVSFLLSCTSFFTRFRMSRRRDRSCTRLVIWKLMFLVYYRIATSEIEHQASWCTFCNTYSNNSWNCSRFGSYLRMSTYLSEFSDYVVVMIFFWLTCRRGAQASYKRQASSWLWNCRRGEEAQEWNPCQPKFLPWTLLPNNVAILTANCLRLSRCAIETSLAWFSFRSYFNALLLVL